MKKLVLILLVFAVAMGIESVKAQNATGNASDHGVPVTTPAPQAKPPGINTPALTVPSAPPLQTLPAPAIPPTPTLPGSAILPAVPSAPAPPPAPPIGALPPTSTYNKTFNLPNVPLLPPLPPIPARPDVRVPVGSN